MTWVGGVGVGVQRRPDVQIQSGCVTHKYLYCLVINVFEYQHLSCGILIWPIRTFDYVSKFKIGHKYGLWRVTKANIRLHLGDLDFDPSRARLEL